MSMMRCACCDGFSDTDDGDGSFEIKGRDYVCQSCLEDEVQGFLDEDTGDIKSEHLSAWAKRDRALRDKGEMMAAMAEDISIGQGV